MKQSVLHASAGARAQQLLPACFQLLECCCEVLVQQATLLEQLADMDDDSTGQQAMTTVLPILQMKEVEQLMMRMQQVTEVGQAGGLGAGGVPSAIIEVLMV